MPILEDARRYLRRFWPAQTTPDPILRRREGKRLPLRRGLTAEKAYQRKLSRVWLTTQGIVTSVLHEDTHGNPHQRFILTTPRGLKVQIAHNTNLAPRVPVSLGDHMIVCGQYLWTKKGGTIHWTHRNPEERCDMGYIYLPKTARRYE